MNPSSVSHHKSTYSRLSGFSLFAHSSIHSSKPSSVQNPANWHAFIKFHLIEHFDGTTGPNGPGNLRRARAQWSLKRFGIRKTFPLRQFYHRMLRNIPSHRHNPYYNMPCRNLQNLHIRKKICRDLNHIFWKITEKRLPISFQLSGLFGNLNSRFSQDQSRSRLL